MKFPSHIMINPIENQLQFRVMSESELSLTGSEVLTSEPIGSKITPFNEELYVQGLSTHIHEAVSSLTGKLISGLKGIEDSESGNELCIANLRENSDPVVTQNNCGDGAEPIYPPFTKEPTVNDENNNEKSSQSENGSESLSPSEVTAFGKIMLEKDEEILQLKEERDLYKSELDLYKGNGHLYTTTYTIYTVK